MKVNQSGRRYDALFIVDAVRLLFTSGESIRSIRPLLTKNREKLIHKLFTAMED